MTVHNAYNNHIDTFSAAGNESGVAKSCTLTITVGDNTYTFSIIPDSSGNFYFNYRPITEKLVNLSNFVDSFDYLTNLGTATLDSNAYIVTAIKKTIPLTDGDTNEIITLLDGDTSQTFTLSRTSATTSETVTLSDGTTVTLSVTETTITIDGEGFVYIRAIDQVFDKLVYNDRGDMFYCHRRNEKVDSLADTREWYARMWIGYPFDFAFYTEEDTTLTITVDVSASAWLASWLASPHLEYESIEKEINTSEQGVYRFSLTDGDSTLDYLNREQYATFVLGDTNVLKLHVLEPCDGGVYLKWVNNQGGWDYWLFERNYVISTNDSEGSYLHNDFSNLEDTLSPSLSSGKTISRTLQLYANGVEGYEIERLLAIASSPKVYMYLGKLGDAHDELNWLEVKLTGKTENRRSQKNKMMISVEIELPTTTMTL